MQASRTSNSKEPQQKYRLGTVSIKILGGLNQFYGYPTSPSANARNPGPKSGTKFCQPNMGTKHACIKLTFTSNLDYGIFLEMRITICFHFFYIFLKFNRNTRPCQAFQTRDQFSQYSRCQSIFQFLSR